MGADQFLLTWNNHRSNFAEVFSQLRVQDQLVDVTLLCDGGSYPAHRLVLAACSPYFHQLFTRLPTQHPIVYLRDVRQAELEALLEFIYRGEVSVANSELTGLIKIAESLRIKGLGDVSQRDPAPFSKPEKRSATPFSNSASLQSGGRPRKAARVVASNNETNIKPAEGDSISSILANNFGAIRQPGFSHLLENSTLTPSRAASSGDLDHDSRDSVSPPPFKDSKLRSCLEGQEPSLGLPMSLLAPSATTSRLVGGLLRREIENREALKKKCKKKLGPTELPFSNNEQEKDEKNVFNDIKQENLSGDEAASPSAPNEEQDSSVLMPPFSKLYEPNELGNTFFTKYTQLLSSFHQQQLQTQMPSQTAIPQPNHVERDEESPCFPSLIPTTVQDQLQISPTPKDTKSLTCQLCGATIKHIANFRRHMKQHLNPRRFPCPWCSAAFGRKDNLKTHTRKHHPTEVEAQEQNLSLPLSEQPDSDLPEVEDDNDAESGVHNGLNESSSPAPVDDDDSGADQNDDSLIIADDEEDDKVDDLENGSS